MSLIYLISYLYLIAQNRVVSFFPPPPSAMRLAASVGAAARRLRLSCGLPRSRRRSLCAFAVPGLRQPEDCARLAHEAAQACEGLVARVVAGASSPTLDVLYGLDEMSETLCRVLDTMELCRNVHPDPAWAEAANSAYVLLAGICVDREPHKVYTG